MATQTHTVVYGDTLSEIADKYKHEYGYTNPYNYMNKLVELNGISNPNVIVIGQVIKLDITGGGSSSGGSSSSTSTPSVPVTSVAGAPSIQLFGLQSNTDRTMYAQWWWNTSNTKEYKMMWEYDTGDGMWFIGNDSTTTNRQATYSAPSNAKRVRFKVKPISTTRKVNDVDTAYWTASWSTTKEYNFSNNPPTKPSVPNIEVKKYKLTAYLENLNVNATHIEFHLLRDNKTLAATGTATINTTSKYASYSWTVSAGSEYKVRCRARRGNLYSDWTEYSSAVGTMPAAPKYISTIRASSETSVYLAWPSVSSATSYDIEYAIDKKYFDGSSETTVVNNITTNHWEVTGLESGDEYFFRLRAVNEDGESAWTAIRSVIIGKAPAAPTTWSSTTTAITGEDLTLYWVHNSEDGSTETYAQLELIVDGVKNTVTIQNESTDEEDVTKYYEVDTTDYPEGSTIQWRVRTAGITKVYGDWSVQRTIDIYAPPTLVLNMMDTEGNVIESLTSFPFNIKAIPGPETQVPIGYHVSIKANEIYETTDNIGNPKTVNKGEILYSKHFDINNTSLEIPISASDVDLQNNISYTIICTVTMNSGLTTESSVNFTVAWTDVVYQPNAEIGYDPDTLVTYIRPYCEGATMKYYKSDYSGNNHILSEEELDITTIVNAYTENEEKVLLGKDAYGEVFYYCTAWEDGNFDPVYYKVEYLSGIYMTTSTRINLNVTTDVYTLTGEKVYVGVDSDGSEVRYCAIESKELVEGILLSVYRREFDGSFTELATELDNVKRTFITDPHPALDFARYRVVAMTEDTGAISYYDVPGYPIGEKAIIIQWDEEWSFFDVSSEDALEQPPWSGSLLKLPYNIEVSNNNSSDVSLIKYQGRKHPVTYYGTQTGETATWNTAIPKTDKETLYALRRLAVWMGDVYVREPSGSGYWANIKVSFSQKYSDLTIPVTLDVTRVEGGM